MQKLKLESPDHHQVMLDAITSGTRIELRMSDGGTGLVFAVTPDGQAFCIGECANAAARNLDRIKFSRPRARPGAGQI